MNESITRAAGGVHGQELDASQLQALGHRIGRPTRQRTTLYGTPDATLVSQAMQFQTSFAQAVLPARSASLSGGAAVD